MKTMILAATAVAIVCAAPEYAHAQKLTQKQFDDGTGSIGLAAGWTFQGAYRGSAQCSGPDGAVVAVGVPWAILRPDSSVTSLPAAAQTPIAQVGDLIGALREVLGKKAGAQLISVRTRPAASPNPGVPAVYAMYEYQYQGKTYTALSYLTALDYGSGSPAWQLYASAVIAPKAQFTKMLPTMMAMWKSWKPNGNAPTAGSESARIDAIIRDKYKSLDAIQKEFRKLL